MPSCNCERPLPDLFGTRRYRRLACAEGWCSRDRPAPGPQPVDDLTRAPPQRVDSDLAPRIQGIDRAVARRTSSSTAKGRQAGLQRCAARLRPRPAVWRAEQAERPSRRPAWPDVERERKAPSGGPSLGEKAGAPNRSPSASRPISPMMSPCGSAMRPSTRRSTCKAVVRSSASWWPACALDEPCGSRGPGPSKSGGAMSALK